MSRRKLTDEETAILHLIRKHYGWRNTEDEITFAVRDEAVILVKDEDGSMPLMANLTNLAAMVADGTISSQAELLRDWLLVEDA